MARSSQRRSVLRWLQLANFAVAVALAFGFMEVDADLWWPFLSVALLGLGTAVVEVVTASLRGGPRR